MNLRKADADIAAAELLLSPLGNPSNDEALLDLAAYHIQQGIEKLLKYRLHELHGADDTAGAFRTHKIYDLINMLEEQYEEVLPADLKKMAITITDWEAESRYNDNLTATREEMEAAIRIYRGLRAEISPAT